MRGRVGQHLNLQVVQYFAKVVIAGTLRVRRCGRWGVSGECDGRISSNEGGYLQEFRLDCYGMAFGTKNSELDGT